MKSDGIYEEFISIATVRPRSSNVNELIITKIHLQNEYSSVFKDLKGENVNFCLPEETVPDAGLEDFTLCT